MQETTPAALSTTTTQTEWAPDYTAMNSRIWIYILKNGTIGGLDLMAVFTKDFWNKTGRDNRARTLEVLRTYGDSTTVLINKPIEQIAR